MNGDSINNKQLIYKNTLWNFLIPLLPLLIGFILMPFIINKIGATVFGFWVLCLSLVGYSGILDMGLSQTIIKKVSELYAVQKFEELKKTCSQIFSLYFLLAIIVTLIFFLISKFTLTSWFQIPSYLENDAQIAFYVIGINAGVIFISKFWEGIVIGIQNFAFRTKIMYFGTFIQFFLTLFLLSYGYGIIALAFINLTIEIFKLLAYYFFVKKNLKVLKISISFHNLNELIPLLSLSIQFFILQACFLVIWQSDRIVIGIFLPLAFITVYEVALKINEAIRSIVASLQLIIFPLASELDSLGKKDHIKQIILIGSKYVFILFFLLAIPAIILSKEFISIWVGTPYLYAANILLVLLLGTMFNAFNYITGQVYQGMGRLKILLIVRTISAVLNIILSIILIQSLGIIGVALGTTLQFALTDIPLLMYLLKNLQISIKIYFKESVLPTALYAAISGFLLFISITEIEKITTNPYILIIVGGIIYLIAYISLNLKYNFKSEERKELLELIMPAYLKRYLIRYM